MTQYSIVGHRTIISAVAIALMWTVLGIQTTAAESRWSAHNPQSTQAPDYSPLDVFFGGYGDKKGSRTTLAYQSMGSRGAKFLDDYVRYLEAIPVSQLNRNEQLAYWLNLHNVAALRETLSAYPMRRVETLITTDGGAWTRKNITVEGVSLSLSDIAFDILLTEWKDPRVIYGIFLPAKGAPALQLRAFRGNNVMERLDDAAGKYINGRNGVLKTGDRPTVSWVYDRYRAVFDNDDAKLISHLQSYARSRLGNRIADASGIAGYEIDWALNEHKPRQPSSGLSGSGGFRGGGGGFGS